MKTSGVFYLDRRCRRQRGNTINKTLPALLATACAVLALTSCGGSNSPVATKDQPPNILFIIMDDVGIDQMQAFGYGGATPPATPNITQIADAESGSATPGRCPHVPRAARCSSGAAIPMRTNVFGARPQRSRELHGRPIRDDRAEAAEERDYQSALFGKFHLAGCKATVPAMRCRGPWAGITSSAGWTNRAIHLHRHHCGRCGPRQNLFLRISCRAAAAGGADQGACYSPDDTCPWSCRALPSRTRRAGRAGTAAASSTRTSPARRRAIQYRLHGAERALRVAPGDQSRTAPSSKLPPTDIRARYLSRQRTRRGDRLDQAAPERRAMDGDRQLRVGAHALAAAAGCLLTARPGSDTNGLDCANTAAGGLSNQMIEALDTEVGRLFVETGLATRRPTASFSTTRRRPTRCRDRWRQRVARIRVKLPFDPDPRQGHGVPDRGMGTAHGCRPPGGPAGPGRRAHDQHRRPVPALRRDRRHRRAQCGAAHRSIRSPCCRT